MASGMNNCVFSGNLCADPRVRTVGENDVCDFTVAVNGRKEGQTTYVQCTMWRPGRVVEYLEKGKPVIVSGEAKLSTWTSKAGEMKAAIGLEVRNLVLGSRGQSAPSQHDLIEEPVNF